MRGVHHRHSSGTATGELLPVETQDQTATMEEKTVSVLVFVFAMHVNVSISTREPLENPNTIMVIILRWA